MNFIKALKLLLKGKRIYNKKINKKDHIIYMSNGLLYCATCNGIPKAITEDMINSLDWREKK